MATYGEVADEARDTIMAVLFDGDVRGKTGWETHSAEYHILRSIAHGIRYLQGDTSESNLDNMITRGAMAKACEGRIMRDDEFSAEGLDR